MKVREIKSRDNRVIGYITETHGKFEARNLQYKILGYYDPKNNRTTDSSYRVLCYGDVLASLVIENSQMKGIW